MPQVQDNFLYRARKPLDSRNQFKTLQEMREYPESALDDGHLTYIIESGKTYIFNRNNSSTEDTGKWRVFGSKVAYFGDDEPTDTNEGILWANTTEGDEILGQSTIYDTILDKFAELNDRLSQVERLQTIGVIAGTSDNSYKSILETSEEPLQPDASTWVETDEWGNPITSQSLSQSKNISEPEEKRYELSIEINSNGEEFETLEPRTEEVSSTVRHIAIKADSQANIMQHRAEYYNGELLWYTPDDINKNGKLVVFYEGKFYAISGTYTPGPEIPDDDTNIEINMEQILSTLQSPEGKLEKIYFKGGDGYSYRMIVGTDGKTNLIPVTDKIESITQVKADEVYISTRLFINSFYVQENIANNINAICTHNFIELANASDVDISLNNMYLAFHCGEHFEGGVSDAVKWKICKLEGVIKGGSTFLIRGGKVNNVKNSLINIDKYDLEWNENGTGIYFNSGAVSFFLFIDDGSETGILAKMKNGQLSKTLHSTTAGSPVPYGYIDLTAVAIETLKSLVSAEKTPLLVNADDHLKDPHWTRILFTRTMPLEPAKQGNADTNKWAGRNTSKYMSYINFNKNSYTINGNTDINYYDDLQRKLSYAPKASSQNKTFFDNKTNFRKDIPNYVNITLGKQATYKDSAHAASRCFNWISIGEFDEYIEYRLIGAENWNRVYSFDENKVNTYDNHFALFIDIYKRFSWFTADGINVTTHKVIISNLNKGDYEYRVGRDGNDLYKSKILKFSVVSDSDVNNFKFIQITDQQGFNWFEYTTWWKTNKYIKEHERSGNKDFYFFINTGDITQSGNRQSEWLDYYTGKEFNIDKEEMFTIGNNDLCGFNAAKLTDGEDKTSKYNHINVTKYFCFELDENNVTAFPTDSSYAYAENEKPGYVWCAPNGIPVLNRDGNFTAIKESLDKDGEYIKNHNGRSQNIQPYVIKENILEDNESKDDPAFYNNQEKLNINELIYKFIGNTNFIWSETSNNVKYIYGIYPIYSCYSFNFGKYHFISLNSEISENTSRVYLDPNAINGKNSFPNLANSTQENWLKKDLQLFKNITDEPTDCKYCIPYLHEMPFTMITYEFIEDEAKQRKGCHMNYLNSNGEYRLSRLFKKYGIRLVLGGHKHTYTISKPIYDAPSDYITSTHTINNASDLMKDMTYVEARKPVIQIPTDTPIPTDDDSVNLARYEYVDKITAPIYVMSQASGYKLVSNKELPSSLATHKIPWLLNYYPAKISTAAGNKFGKDQYNPMYIVYELTDDNITIEAKQVTNIWSLSDGTSDEADKAVLYLNKQNNKQRAEKSVTLCNSNVVSSIDYNVYNNKGLSIESLEKIKITF